MPNQPTQQALEPWIDRAEQSVRKGAELSRRGWAKAWPWIKSHPRSSAAGAGVACLFALVFVIGIGAALSGGGGGGYSSGSYGGGGYGGYANHPNYNENLRGYNGGSPADRWVGPNDWQTRHSSGTWAGQNSVISPPGGGVLNLPPY